MCVFFLFLFFYTFTLFHPSVEPTDCDTSSVHFTLKDSSFTIKTNGVIEALSTVTVATERTFSVSVRDARGLESEMEVHLVHRQLQKREVKLLHFIGCVIYLCQSGVYEHFVF